MKIHRYVARATQRWDTLPVARTRPMGYRPLKMSAPVPAPARMVHLELISRPSFTARSILALRDIAEASTMWRLCWTLAWLDIKLRYRGSVLGPFWLTLSTAVMIGSMGFLYGTLFQMDLLHYFPFLALSIVLWNFLGTLISEACVSFTQAEGMIRAVRMPFTLYAGRVVLRNLLVLAHNVVVIIGVDILVGLNPGFIGLLAIPAFLLWLAVAVALCLLLGVLCARFRDIPPIVASIVQIAFFMSAVIWQPDQLKTHEYLLDFNPFFTLLQIVRGPMLGELPSASVYASAFIYSGLVFLASWLVFSRVRGRIAFWV
jgi:lipopolysaccharide transport system permease protein